LTNQVTLRIIKLNKLKSLKMFQISKKPSGIKLKTHGGSIMSTATVLAKRRPGRPKKADTVATTTDTITAAETTPVKRGPGRPRKDATATAPAVKRGPGRPRKDATATAPAVKRGPGRPRKDATATAPVAKRGPGRPRKNPVTSEPVAKRRPGRPRKNPVTSTAPAPRQSKKDAGARQVLVNPFKAGDTVVIPAGVTYTSTAPTAKGRQVAKRGHKVTVSDLIPAKVQPRKSETGSNILVRPPRIRAKGSGGYWKDITLNEKIVKLNGKTPSYETIDAKAPADVTV
jgi:hypothetical protein